MLSNACKRGLLVPTIGLVLSACGAVGNGVTPDRIEIFPQGATAALVAQQGNIDAFACVPQSLRGVLYFDNGSAGDYSGRLTWTSSDPNVATVATHGQFGAVSLLPKSAGTATITAKFYTLQTSFQVTVSGVSVSDLSIQKLDFRTLKTIPAGGFTLAAQSGQNLVLVGNLGGVRKDISDPSITQWTVTDAGGGADTRLSVAPGSAALVLSAPKDDPNTTANEASAAVGSYTLNASIGNGACPVPLTVSVPFSVAAIPAGGLVLAPQADAVSGPALGYADASGNPLPLIAGNTEHLSLTATFADGQQQDLTLLGTYVSSNSRLDAGYGTDPSIKNVANFDFSSLLSAGTLSTLAATDLGTTDVYATYDDGISAAPIGSNHLTITTVQGGLQSITVAPTTGTVTATDSFDGQPYHAIGTFDVNGAPVTQDVSRQTHWTATDPATGDPSTLAGVYSIPNKFGVLGGLAIPAQTTSPGGQVAINASITPAGSQACATAPCAALTGTASLTVNPSP